MIKVARWITAATALTAICLGVWCFPAESQDSVRLACDGQKDDTATFNQAIRAGSRFIIVSAGKPCRITDALDLSTGITITGEDGARPRLITTEANHASLFRCRGQADVTIRNLSVDLLAYKKPVGSAFDLDSCDRFKIENVHIARYKDTAISIRNSADGKVLSTRIIDGQATGIVIEGPRSQRNLVQGVTINGTGGFGILVRFEASHNELLDNRTVFSKLELIGVRHNSHHNIIQGNVVSGSGDNGISVTGSHNRIIRNRAYNNARAGIGIYGEHNFVENNETSDNNQYFRGDAGVTITPGFGGLGSNNIIASTKCPVPAENSPQVGCVLEWPSIYQKWAPRTLVNAANPYRVFGDCVYEVLNLGVTGDSFSLSNDDTATDGQINWKCVKRFSAPVPAGNRID